MNHAGNALPASYRGKLSPIRFEAVHVRILRGPDWIPPQSPLLRQTIPASSWHGAYQPACVFHVWRSGAPARWRGQDLTSRMFMRELARVYAGEIRSRSCRSRACCRGPRSVRVPGIYRNTMAMVVRGVGSGIALQRHVCLRWASGPPDPARDAGLTPVATDQSAAPRPR